MLANLKVLSGAKAIEALKISDDSIFVQESVKELIDNSEIKKASNLIQKNWEKNSMH